MKLSAKTEYACLAMIELASAYTEQEPVRVRAIAEEHGIPSRFLVQILLQLKSTGLVASTRGAAGGYQLARHPRDITLGQVITAIEGNEFEIASNTDAISPCVRALLSALQMVADQERDLLGSISLSDLAEQAAEARDAMYYI